MSKNFSKKIKEELLKNIKCKKCNSFYDIKGVSIKSLGGDKSFISAHCYNCDLETQFEANISKEQNTDSNLIEKEDYVDLKQDVKLVLDGKLMNESIIKTDEIKNLNYQMKNFSSFKNFFSIALVFSFIFTGCAESAEQNRQNILNSIDSVKTQFETTKNQAEDIYKDGKIKFDQVKNIMETAPEKIEKAKTDIEKITADAIKLKNDLEKKVEDTKKAIDETKKAVDAVSDAMDSINAIAGE